MFKIELTIEDNVSYSWTFQVNIESRVGGAGGGHTDMRKCHCHTNEVAGLLFTPTTDAYGEEFDSSEEIFL